MILTEIIQSFIDDGVDPKTTCERLAQVYAAGVLGSTYRNEPRMLVGLDNDDLRFADVASKTATDIAGKSFR